MPARRRNGLTALDDPVHFLHWSPDGSAIAFTIAPGGMNEQVYSVRSDGTGLRRLTDGGPRVAAPAPPGRRLVPVARLPRVLYHDDAARSARSRGSSHCHR